MRIEDIIFISLPIIVILNNNIQVLINSFISLQPFCLANYNLSPMRGLGEGEIYLAKEVCLTEIIQSLQCSDNPYCACV